MPPASSSLKVSVASVEPVRGQPTLDVAPGGHTYGQILRSSALIGGSSFVDIAVGIVRGKAMAILLGPAGVGLLGLFGSIVDLTVSLAGMGINSSGVRQIAEAARAGEAQRIAQTAAVLRRVSIVLGVLGAVLLVVFCRPLSMRTFGSNEFAAPVALLSLAVLFRLITEGQRAQIQGMRRIGDLARIGVWATLLGTAITLGLVYFFREQGVVPSLISGAAVTLIVSCWYQRKVQIPVASLGATQARKEAAALLKLGFVFMVSAVLTTGAAYAIRSMVRDQIGFEAAGLYQSAWTLGGMYVGFILQAMASDFYPRLTASADNNAECNRLVNEQAQISLLLAGPGVIATLTLAPLVLTVFYDARFAGATEPLRWICLGMALRVVAWPMGFIILAKGLRSLMFWAEFAASIVHVGLAFTLVGRFGLAGATMAFFGLYVWHGILVYIIVHRISGFHWSAANRRTGVFFLPLIGVVFSNFLVLPVSIATAVGIVAVFVSGIYSLRAVCRLVSLDRVPRFLRDLLVWFRISSPHAMPPVFDAPSEV